MGLSLFQNYGPSGAYPSQSPGFGPLPLTAAWAQTVLKQRQSHLENNI